MDGKRAADVEAREFKVVTPDENRMSEAAHVLMLANRDDPLAATLISRGALKRDERLQLMYLAELHQAGADRVDVAVDLTYGQVLGVAAWSGPPRPRWAGGPTAADSARWAVSSLAALGHTGTLASRRIEREVGRVQPPEPHWHLLDLAVHPHAQRRGIGNALLEHRLPQVDAEARRAFLCATTPESERLYERHGFVAQRRLPARAGGAMTMIRRPVITA